MRFVGFLEGGPQGTTQSSTVVDLNSEEPSLPREGDITRTDLNDVVEIS